MGKYLKRWGLSFQRPDKHALEQDPEAVRARYEERRPTIRAKAQKEGAEALFADQTGVRSDQVSGRTWAPRGQTPTMRRTGNRFSANTMSAISPRGRMWFTVYRGSFTAEVFCDFLDRLNKQFDRPVHLVVDRRSVYRSRRVGQCRPETAPAAGLPSPQCRPDRRRGPLLLPPPTETAAHRPWLLRGPARPPHHRGAGNLAFRINRSERSQSG
ncbi:transposase [Kitasatospora cineracea]|uniref:transposase n=1 Tax=Kitasatospora cineracea TaxID=88074 RepID=UPI003431E342